MRHGQPITFQPPSRVQLLPVVCPADLVTSLVDGPSPNSDCVSGRGSYHEQPDRDAVPAAGQD